VPTINLVYPNYNGSEPLELQLFFYNSTLDQLTDISSLEAFGVSNNVWLSPDFGGTIYSNDNDVDRFFAISAGQPIYHYSLVYGVVERNGGGDAVVVAYAFFENIINKTETLAG
jgi:hypothetical protein